MSQTRLSLAGNNLINVFPARESSDSDIQVGDGKTSNLFYNVRTILIKSHFMKIEAYLCNISVRLWLTPNYENLHLVYIFLLCTRGIILKRPPVVHGSSR
jgi:hypothetical protein